MDKTFNSMRYSEDWTIDDSDKRISIFLGLIGKGKRVLDLGCGDGFVCEMLLKNNNEVVGVEVSEAAIKKAKNKGIKVYDCDLSSDWSSLVEGKFDVVLAGEIIEHVFDTDKFLRNVRSVLKEEGRLILSTPNLASLGRRIFLLFGRNPLIELTARKDDAGHIRYFTFGSLKKLLEENGFKLISFRSDYVNFDKAGKVRSSLMANLFPTLGSSLIGECRKIPS
jgi:methionine biosynthesis protein MetW